MTDIHRYYECGCVPDDEEFCTIGDFLLWTGRHAAQEWALLENGPPSLKKRLQFLDGEASRLLGDHFRHQEERGEFEDVDLDAPEMQPPDDGYDEDPRIVGYPS